MRPAPVPQKVPCWMTALATAPAVRRLPCSHRACSSGGAGCLLVALPGPAEKVTPEVQTWAKGWGKEGSLWPWRAETSAPPEASKPGRAGFSVAFSVGSTPPLPFMSVLSRDTMQLRQLHPWASGLVGEAAARKKTQEGRGFRPKKAAWPLIWGVFLALAWGPSFCALSSLTLFGLSLWAPQEIVKGIFEQVKRKGPLLWAWHRRPFPSGHSHFWIPANI